MYQTFFTSGQGGGGSGTGFEQGITKSISNGQTDENVTGMSLDRSTYKGGLVYFCIERGTTIFASGFLHLQDLNGTWRVQESLFAGNEHGLTWDMSESSGIGTVNYDSDSIGAGNLYWGFLAKVEA